MILSRPHASVGLGSTFRTWPGRWLQRHREEISSLIHRSKTMLALLHLIHIFHDQHDLHALVELVKALSSHFGLFLKSLCGSLPHHPERCKRSHGPIITRGCCINLAKQICLLEPKVKPTTILFRKVVKTTVQQIEFNCLSSLH